MLFSFTAFFYWHLFLIFIFYRSKREAEVQIEKSRFAVAGCTSRNESTACTGEPTFYVQCIKQHLHFN